MIFIIFLFSYFVNSENITSIQCREGQKAGLFGGCEEMTRCEKFGQGEIYSIFFDLFSECQWKCEESNCICPAGYYQSELSVVTCHDVNECVNRKSS